MTPTNTFKYIIIYVSLVYYVKCKFLDFKKDEISLDIKYVRSCQKNYDNKYNVTIVTKKFNRTHISFSGNINLTDIVDNKFKIAIEMRSWGDGGWKKNFFSHKTNDPCNTARFLIGPVWTKLTEAANIPSSCPIPPGYYSMEDKYFDFSKVPVILQDGRFYIIGKVLKDNVLYVCGEGEFGVTKLIHK